MQLSHGPPRKHFFPVSPLVSLRNLLPNNRRYLENRYLATGLHVTIYVRGYEYLTLIFRFRANSHELDECSWETIFFFQTVGRCGGNNDFVAKLASWLLHLRVCDPSNLHDNLLFPTSTDSSWLASRTLVWCSLCQGPYLSLEDESGSLLPWSANSQDANPTSWAETYGNGFFL